MNAPARTEDVRQENWAGLIACLIKSPERIRHTMFQARMALGLIREDLKTLIEASDFPPFEPKLPPPIEEQLGAVRVKLDPSTGMLDLPATMDHVEVLNEIHASQALRIVADPNHESIINFVHNTNARLAKVFITQWLSMELTEEAYTQWCAMMANPFDHIPELLAIEGQQHAVMDTPETLPRSIYLAIHTAMMGTKNSRKVLWADTKNHEWRITSVDDKALLQRFSMIPNLEFVDFHVDLSVAGKIIQSGSIYELPKWFTGVDHLEAPVLLHVDAHTIDWSTIDFEDTPKEFQ